MDAGPDAGHVPGMEPDDLDRLLTLADPATAPRGTDDPWLRELASEIETAATPRSRRRGRRTVVIGAALAAVLGAGGIAQATGWFGNAPRPASGDWSSEPGTVTWPVVLASGGTCTATYSVTPDEAAGERLGLDAEAWRAVLATAQEVTSGIEVADLDVDAAAARYMREYDAARRALLEQGLPRHEVAPPLRVSDTPDSIRISAVGAEIWERVETALRIQGLPVEALSMSSSDDCLPEELNRDQQ